MKPKDLVLLMLEHSQNLNPTYTKEQQLVWALGMLADVVCEKNLNDNVVWARLSGRIDELYKQRND